MLLAFFSIWFAIQPVKAGVCKKIEGYVQSFNGNTLVFKELKKKTPTELKISALSTEQKKFMKDNVHKLISECVAINSFIPKP